MNIDHHRVYDSSNDFFSLAGSIVMKLTAEAAIAVCEQAAEHGVVVARIEGGIWRNPGFEARVDCIFGMALILPLTWTLPNEITKGQPSSFGRRVLLMTFSW